MIQPIEKSSYLCTKKRNKQQQNNILKNKNMKRVILFSLMALMTVCSFRSQARRECNSSS